MKFVSLGSLSSITVSRAYGLESSETERLAELAGGVRDARIDAVKRRSWFDALTNVIPALANIALVLLGAARVDSGNVTIGEFSSVIFLFTLLVLPLRLIGYALSELPRSMAAWLRIQTIVSEPVLDDPAQRIEQPAPGVGIELEAVSFTHGAAEGAALRDVSVAVGLGSVTALVGPTGSGKSTLADLVLGLTSPSAGVVRLSSGPRSMVFQEAFLVAGSIRDNIAFGDDVSDEQIWSACHTAAIDDFVRELPDGLDTVVGERGVSLSGGQRQRVALARALVRSPRILVLDDTTSALDPSTERVILQRLRLELDATVLMVASRPSTIALADTVLFMTNGQIEARGQHHELLKTNAAYREIVEAFEADRVARP